LIFYTLQGPQSTLEIHDDKIRVTKKNWWGALSRQDQVLEFSLNNLAQFNIASPKFVWGRLEWSTFEGAKGSFRFSTNALMMDKIEKYMHKLVLKNIQRQQNVIPMKRAHLNLVGSEAA
jgi:hypothetical protein